MTKSEILKKAAQDEGYATVLDMLAHYTTEGSVPCYCTKCGQSVDDREPDVTEDECEDCGTNTVQSVLVIAGLI